MIKEIGRNKYRLVVSVGTGEARTRHTKTVTCGKKEAKKLYEAFKAELQDTAPSSGITIGELLDGHLAYTKTLGRKATTMRGYTIAVNRFSSRFKSIKADKCTPHHIEKEIALMQNKSLSAKTIKNTIGLLSASYEHAIRTQMIDTNPCRYITLPKEEPKEMRILHHDEIQPFLYAIADVDLNEKVAYELALFMGLRRSEILGLKEDDVDIVNGMLYIHNTRHRVYGEDIVQDTKTKRSTRVLAMPEIVALDVARLLEVHRQFKYESTDYLVQDGFGNILNPQALASRLHRLEVKKGLPNVTLHGLRHTYASLLHSQGIDMARISAELGHSNLTTTANIYTHIFESASQSSRGIASAIDDVVTKTPRIDTELSTSDE